ncbi:unnamed protein product [Sympodiomycopsis kandeliae]
MSFSRNAVRPFFRNVAARASPAKRLAGATRCNSTVNTSGASHAGKKYGGDPKSSDVPWIIGSTLFFGSAFIYVTSPSSKTHNEHGQVTGAKAPSTHGTGSSRVDDKTGDEAVWKQEDHDGSVEEDEVPADDAPEGDKHLHHNTNRATPDQQKSPANRDPSSSTYGIENSNFKHGIAASKDGDHVSDPKKVVAQATSDKQARRAEQQDPSISNTDSQSEEEDKEIEEAGSKGDDK